MRPSTPTTPPTSGKPSTDPPRTRPGPQAPDSGATVAVQTWPWKNLSRSQNPSQNLNPNLSLNSTSKTTVPPDTTHASRPTHQTSTVPTSMGRFASQATIPTAWTATAMGSAAKAEPRVHDPAA